MISTEQTQDIAATCNKLGVDESVIATLRQQYPGIHFTYCMDDDIPNHEPVITHPGFNLYLIDGREHCLCLTQDYSLATGVVVAEIIAE
ncbi:MAG: DUF6129 family protein [Methylovulum sp.]|nr:DUF6129 family protein [Methylovulum sp.]